MEQIFKDNPKLDVAYKTTDGKFFFLENDARNHATNLENKKVIKVERTEEALISDDNTPIVSDDIKGNEEPKGDLTDSVKNIISEEKKALDEITNEVQELKEDTPDEDVKGLEDETKEIQQEPNTEAVEPVAENKPTAPVENAETTSVETKKTKSKAKK